MNQEILIDISFGDSNCDESFESFSRRILISIRDDHWCESPRIVRTLKRHSILLRWFIHHCLNWQNKSRIVKVVFLQAFTVDQPTNLYCNLDMSILYKVTVFYEWVYLVVTRKWVTTEEKLKCHTCLVFENSRFWRPNTVNFSRTKKEQVIKNTNCSKNRGSKTIKINWKNKQQIV